jgi:hypothetical protein
MKLIKVTESPLATKKLRAHFEDDDRKFHVDFGLKGSNSYIDGASDKTRENYIKRHSVLEKAYWNVPSTPAALSRFVIWGDSRSLQKNVSAFKKKFGL